MIKFYKESNFSYVFVSLDEMKIWMKENKCHLIKHENENEFFGISFNMLSKTVLFGSFKEVNNQISFATVYSMILIDVQNDIERSLIFQEFKNKAREIAENYINGEGRGLVSCVNLNLV